MPARLGLLLDQAAQGSGAYLLVERGSEAPMFCDAAAAEAERRRFGVRRAVGSPHPFGAFEVVCELLGVDVEAPDAAEIRCKGTALPGLRALAERVDALCVGGAQLVLVDRAEHVDTASARFLGYLAQHLEARSASLLLVAAEVPPRSWLDDLASGSLGGVLRLPASPAGERPHAVRPRSTRLGGAGDDVADALAVLGPGASLAAVAAVSGEPTEVVLRALDHLAAHGALRRTTTGAGHLVVADDVLDAMAPTRRADLHQRAAVHARSVGESAVRLATHLEHVVPGTLPWAAEHLRAGAALALRSDDAPSAVRWLRRAIEEDRSAGADVPVPALLELAQAQSRAADAGAAETLRLAVEASSGDERTRLRIRLARQLSVTGRLREAVDVFDDVLAGLDPCDPSTHRVRVEARVGIATASRCSLELRPRSAVLLRELSEEVARGDVDAPDLLAELAYEHALAGTCRDTVLHLAGRATAAMRRRRLGAVASQALFLALAWAEDLDAAALLCDRLHGDDRHDPVGAHRRATIALGDGDLHLAVACARVAVGDIEWAAPMLVPGARAQLARALVRLGDLDGAEAALQLPGGEGRWRQQAGYHPVLLAKAELAAARAEWRRAASFADQCAEFSRAMGTRNPAVVPWQEVSARALAALGRVDDARSLLAEAVERATEFGAPGALARLERARDEVGGIAPTAERPVEPPAAPAASAAPVDDRVLRLLGDTVLVVDGDEHRLGDDLADRAVCVVALARSGIHDEQLAEALWPDGDPAVGRTRLRNVLLRVRQRHGPIVERRGRSIALVDDVTVDLHEFDRLADEALGTGDPGHAERVGRRALELHRGDLCPVHPFEPWADAPRTAVRQRWLALADRLAHLAAERGDLAGSLAITEQAVAVDPYDEDRYLDAVERLAAADRPAAARSLLRRSELMCADLGVPPSPRHRALTSSIR